MSPVNRANRLARACAALLLAAPGLLGTSSSASRTGRAPPAPGDRRGMPPPGRRPCGRPLDAGAEAPPRPAMPDFVPAPGRFFRTRVDPPVGYTGPSGVLPTRAADLRRLRPGRGPLADRLSRVGPLRQGAPDPGRLPLHARPLVRPVQPERLEGRLPDLRPAHLPRRLRPGLAVLRAAGQIPTPASGGSRARRGPARADFFGRPSQFFNARLLLALVRPVPRRRRLQAGRLADQGHADAST